MSNDTTPTPKAKAKWSDNEKITLLVSVINELGGNPNWAKISIPAHRTLRSAQWMYSELKKEAATVPTAGGDGEATPTGKKRGAKAAGDATAAVTPAKKRGKAGGGEEDGIPNSGKKRGRKPKNKTQVDEEDTVNGSDEERLKKKVKLEDAEEDGEEVDDGAE